MFANNFDPLETEVTYITIFVETLTGAAYELTCLPEETVEIVKERVRAVGAIPPCQQHLIWQSQELEDSRSLESYDIRDGATLKLMFYMQSGNRGVTSEHQNILDFAQMMADMGINDSSGTGNSLAMDNFFLGQSMDCEDGNEIFPTLETFPKFRSFLPSCEETNETVFDEETLKENELTKRKVQKIRKQLRASRSKKKEPDNHPFSLKLPLPPGAINCTSDFSASASSMNCNNTSAGGCSSVISSVASENPFEKAFGNEPVTESELCFKNSSLISKCSFSDPWQPKLFQNNDSSNNSEGTSLHLLKINKNCQFSNNSNDDEFLKENLSTLKSVSVKERNIFPFLNSSSFHQNSSSEPFLNLQNPTPVINTGSLYRVFSLKARKVGTECRHIPLTSNPEISRRQFLTLDQWIDNRPKTMPQENLCLQLDSIIQNHICGVHPSVSRIRVKGKEKSVAKQTIHSSFPSDYKSNSHAQTSTRERGCKWNPKPSIACKSGVDISNILPKLSIPSLMATGIKDTKKQSRIVHEDSDNLPDTVPNRIEESKESNGAVPKLPPIKSTSSSKKLCSWCRKKTGLTTTYTCRCKLDFCPTHRYPETHKCSYDFKSEGRKLIKLKNPVVVPPKLPKI